MIPRILVVAGEPSGDLHGAHVVTAIRERLPEVAIEAVGGPRLAAAGAVIRRSLEGLSAMGFVEILNKIPAHVQLRRELAADFAKGRYQLVIVVDYPGFNLRVAEAARRAGIPVLGYIAPQLWAWRPSRAVRWSRAVNKLAVILPFEPLFLKARGIDATYVGHPLVDRQSAPDRALARIALGLPSDAKVLALFPGSRRGEVRRLWPAYRDAAIQLLDEGSCSAVVVAGTEWGEYPGSERFIVTRDAPEQVLAAADAVLAKSGTTTLEAALADVPMVVAYRTHPLTFAVAKRLVTVPWVSLVNLIAEREVVSELVQSQVTTERLVAEIRPLLDPTSIASRQQRAGLSLVRERLGGPGASARVADLAIGLLAA
jgi:lipid-A-disaccharide synthase